MREPNKINPYPGFRPYKHDEAHIFFGRAKEQDELLHYLASRNFVSILGMSGVGKSSLIQAGLLADLNAGYLAGSRNWVIVELYPNPNKQPFEKLATELSKKFREENEEAVTAEQLRADTQVEFIESLLEQKNKTSQKNYKLLILADQFEEIFDLKYEEIKAFTDFLLNVTNRSMDIHVVLGMRAEFIGKCSPYYEFAERVNQTVFLVPRLKLDKVTDVIRYPLEVVNTSVTAEDEFIDELKKQLSNSKEDLTPSLQFVLRKLFYVAHENKQPLSWSLYQEKIGVDLKDAISHEAKKIYLASEPIEKKKAIEALFRELVDVSHDKFIKKVAEKDVVEQKIKKEQKLSEFDLNDIIKLFKNDDFTVLKEIGNKYIEITHDNLIDEWGILNDWAKNEKFKDEYRKKESEYQDKLKIYKLKVIIVSSFTFLLMTFFLTFKILISAKIEILSNYIVTASIYSQSENYSQSKKSLNKLKNFDGLGNIPDDLAPTHKLLSRMTSIKGTNTFGQNLNTEITQPLLNLAVSDDRKLLAVSNKESKKNKIYILDVITGKNLQVFDKIDDDKSYEKGNKNDDKDKKLHFSFYPNDSKRFITAYNKKLKFWSLADGSLLYESEEFNKSITAIFASKQLDSLFVATSTDVFTLSLDNSSQALPLKMTIQYPIHNLAILQHQSHGNLLVVYTSNHEDNKEKKETFSEIQMWSLSPYKKIKSWSVPSKEIVYALAINENNQLAIATDRSNIYLWDMEKNLTSNHKQFTGHQSEIYALSFINEELLASGGRDADIRIWDIKSGVTLKVLQQHTADVNGLAYIGNNELVSIGYDHKIIKWPIKFPFQHWTYTESKPMTTAINLAHDNVLVGFADGTVALYDLPSGSKKFEKRGQIRPSEHIKRIALNQDGNLAATVGYDLKLNLLAVGSDNLQSLLNEPIDIKTSKKRDGLTAVAFASDKKIAVATYSGKVFLVDLENDKQQEYKDIRHTDIVTSVAFDKTGQKLLTASRDGQLLLTDVRTKKVLKNYTRHNPTRLMWASFNADISKIVAGNKEGSVLVFNTETAELERTFNGHKNTIYRVEFSPDGQHIFSVSTDNTVKIWNMNQALNIENLFTLALPSNKQAGGFSTLEDMSFSCNKAKGCWLVVPLSLDKKLLSYNLGHIYSEEE